MPPKDDRQFRKIAETAPIIIIRFDKKLRHSYVNPATEQKIGLTAQALLGKTPQQADLPQEVSRIWIESLKKVFQSKKGCNIEFEYPTRAGEAFYHSQLVPEFDEKGEVESVLVFADDVTDLRQTQETLRESEERYRRFFEEDLSGNFISTPEGKVLACNPSFARIFGYASVRQALQMNPYVHYLEPTERDRYVQLLKDKKRLINYQRRMKRRDGTIAHIVSNITGEFDEQGTLVQIQGFILDETDRLLAEEQLRQSVEQFRKVFEEGPLGMALVSLDFKIIQANREICSMLEYTQEELQQVSIQGITHPEDYDKDIDLAKRLLAGDIPSYEIEKRYITKQGNILWGHLTVSILRESGGKPLYLLGMVQDITKQKQAIELLRQSEEKYRSLFEESKDVVFISTPHGKFIDINQAGVELFGYSSKTELLRADIAHDLYVDSADRAKSMKLMAEQGFLKEYESVVRSKEGKKLVVLETTTAMRNEKGEIVAYRGIIRDVTEQRMLEERLRHAQKMESVGTLAGGIAHDFNNILGIILGYVGGLEHPDINPEKHAHNVEAIKRAVNRGSGLVRQLLTFARKGEGAFASVNVNDTVSEITKLLAETFPESIRFHLQLSPVVSTIHADESQLQQAILNLCVNARDALLESPSKTGTITLTTEQLSGEDVRSKFQEATGDEYMLAAITDDGIGINDVIRNRIFEPFFTTKPHGKGTGLGLPVVYGIVKSHHGFIDLESEVGKGTTVRLYFPTKQNEMEVMVAQQSDASVPMGKGETVLLVEDEEMLLDLLQTLLEENGYRVLTAKDGLEAVATYTHHVHEIQVVLSDMGLPKLGGWEAFQKMREINPNVKSILASGYLDPNLRAEMIQAGAMEFVQKPYVPEKILDLIRRVIDGTIR